MVRCKNGQSIVEFALILPIVLLLIMGVLDLGRAFFMKIALVNAAREGASYLAYHPLDKTTCTVFPSDCYDGTRQAVVNEAYAAGLTVDPADIVISNCCTNGETVQVTVSSEIQLMIFDFFFGPLDLSHTARMKMLK